MTVWQRTVHSGAAGARQGAVVVSSTARQRRHHGHTDRDTGRVDEVFRGGQPSPRAGPSRYGRGRRGRHPVAGSRYGTGRSACRPGPSPHRGLGRCAPGSRAAPDLRGGPAHPDDGVVDHRQTGDQTRCALRHAGARLRIQRRRPDRHLRGRHLQPYRLRPPRLAEPAHPGHRLRLPRHPRGHDARQRYVPHRSARTEAVHLHQLRRPVRPAGDLGGQRHGGARRELHPRDEGHRHRHRAGRPALPPAQRRPVLREPGRRPGAYLEQLLHQQHTFRALPTLDARGSTTTRSRRPTARSGSAPTRATSPCPPPRPTPNSRACGTRSRSAPSG